MEQSQGSEFPAKSPAEKLARKLGRRSPVRIWLDLKQKQAASGSAERLLDVLAHPQKLDWKELAVGYRALGEIELSPPERSRAAQLLLPTLTPLRSQAVLIRRLGRATALGFVLCLLGVAGTFLASRLFHQSSWFPASSDEQPYVTAIVSFALSALITPLITPFCFAGLVKTDRKRTATVKRAVLETLLRQGSPECVVALFKHINAYPDLRPQAMSAFRSALAALQTDSNGRIPYDTLRTLEDMTFSPEEDLALDALDALCRFGNESSAKPVERLLTSTVSARLRAQIKAILPVLLARGAHEAAAFGMSAEATVGTLPEASFLPSPGMQKWERKLRRDSPIHSWLLRRRANAQESSADTLLNAMEDPNAADWADRIVAYAALREQDLTPPQRSRAGRLLLQALTPHSKKETFFPRLGAAVLQTGVLGFVAAIVLEVATRRFDLWDYLLIPPILMGFLTPLALACLSMRDHHRTLTVQRAALEALTRTGDPEGIVTLAQYVHHRPRLRWEAKDALKAILPTVDASWYGRLPAEGTAALASLALSSDKVLALAALGALGEAGGGAAAETVERIVGDTTRGEAICARASAVLPILLARREREQSAASLLRASDRVATDHLLKPVYSSEPEVANLLRASHGDMVAQPHDSRS